ncbi:tetratricopeptide repeat protein [Pelagicoccus sp. SDUM812002]|uniref:tetratricopeptide repeat protein n=1 Tax=Pelagicoccus sp. SDUM812002 TaxID=3041266 RepID=UPI00280F6A59|nr:tetratricopeptide repeat protein [Pelagicoccus sp. SDUM812002]MDQ8186490.1 tetratricopeptide repeat protein [Pelagicoccus sp. SDUM812002]
MSRTTIWTLVGGLFVVLVVGGLWVYQPHARETRWHKEAIAALPPVPADATYPELIARIENAEKQVRSGDNWRSQLGSLASLYHANGYTSEAVSLYGILVRTDENNGRWTNRLASLYALYGQLDQSMLLWQRTTQIAPSYLPAKLNLADAMIKTNRAPEAAPIYKTVLIADPKNPYAIAGLAQADMAAGHWERAKERLEGAGLATETGIGENTLVTVYEHLGEIDKARALRSRAKSTDSYIEVPDPWIDEVSEDCYDPYRLTLEAGAARRKRELPRAQRLLETAIQVDPEYAHAHFQMGLLQLELQNRQAAKEALRQSVDLDPSYGDGWSQLIAISTSQPEAARLLEEGLRKCPDSPSLHSLNGNRLRMQGRLDEALEAFKKVAELRPAEILGLINCSQIYYQRGQTELAVQTLEDALQILPEDPIVLWTLAVHWIETKNEAKALEHIERCQAQPRVPPANLQRAKDAFQSTFGNSPW